MEKILQVGVKVFLKNKEGKYLLLKRSHKKYDFIKQKWDIVGGRIETGTFLIENLTREIFEETQISTILNPRLLYAQDIFFKEFHVVRLTYVADTDQEPILDTSENIEYKWITLEEMKQQEDLDQYVQEILDTDLIK